MCNVTNDSLVQLTLPNILNYDVQDVCPKYIYVCVCVRGVGGGGGGVVKLN